MTVYIRLPDGTICNDPPAPTQAWTPEEWVAKISVKERQIQEIQGQIDGMPKLKEKPDEETLIFYNSHVDMMLGNDLQSQINQLRVELGEMKAV